MIWDNANDLLVRLALIPRDVDNWGIIDPETLHILLVPNDTNRDEAKHIVGQALPDQIDVKDMISIQEEANKLRIK
ncbi:MAG: hypothetical protein EPO08_16435 [Rhodospirillaceae bacterium]|nr:MAG: hypothetical protein EPO08_16435 [Rhodospirillaceae bacterium]